MVLSIHSFTPIYEGIPREVEIGVLFHKDESLAQAMGDHIAASTGLDVRMNEPYSGANGLMFSAYQHAKTHSRPSLELEIRQDLSKDPAFQRTIVSAVSEGLVQLGYVRG
jgi:predicted N-formylglutamate amidohydrolase